MRFLILLAVLPGCGPQLLKHDHAETAETPAKAAVGKMGPVVVGIRVENSDSQSCFLTLYFRANVAWTVEQVVLVTDGKDVAGQLWRPQPTSPKTCSIAFKGKRGPRTSVRVEGTAEGARVAQSFDMTEALR